MSTSIEIYSKVGEYLSRTITLQELESWLVDMWPTFLQNSDSAVSELAAFIELCLSEINAGIRTERSLKTLLKQHPGVEAITLTSYPITSNIDMTSSANDFVKPIDFPYFDQSPSGYIEFQEVRALSPDY